MTTAMELSTPECRPVLLLSAREAARLCGKSLRTWRSWDAAGLVPAPLRVGRSVLWRRADLVAWVATGCPPRPKRRSGQSLE